jgi:hypothetical protein
MKIRGCNDEAWHGAERGRPAPGGYRQDENIFMEAGDR